MQGRAVSRGLLVAGQPAPKLGGCEKKNKQIPLSGSQNYGLNAGMGLGGASVSMEIAYSQLTTQSSAWDSTILRFERTSATAKTWFQC
jgi:hypothetical protein